MGFRKFAVKQIISEQMCPQEIGIFSVFWHEILYRVNTTSQTLQNTKLDLNAAVVCFDIIEECC